MANPFKKVEDFERFTNEINQNHGLNTLDLYEDFVFDEI